MSKSESTSVYAMFHLNLAFSSIGTEQHEEVVKRCYWPLLELIEDHDIPLGIELTVFTIESILAVDPKWIEKLVELARLNKCEILASGDTQIIGPLVPYIVNHHNIRLGQLGYKQFCHVEPKIAYVNEQAVSSGILDVYIEQDFDAVVVEWDNSYSHNPHWDESFNNHPQSLLSASGKTIKVIWNNAITFQKFQRYAHDELSYGEVVNYFEELSNTGISAIPIYGNDAEIFDFRPGRYNTEPTENCGEWQRIQKLFNAFSNDSRFSWKLPSEILELWCESEPLKITNANHPISVKKQAKYNVTRWALSGRDDLALNTLCYRNLALLNQQKNISDEQWRALCRLWASDYRTHITENRFEDLKNKLAKSLKVTEPFIGTNDNAITPLGKFKIDVDPNTLVITVITPNLILNLNAKRGLTIESLAFNQHDFVPVVGTLHQGTFSHINYGVDYYSNHLLIERFKYRDRITDLSKVDWQVREKDNGLIISTTINTPEGDIEKWYEISGDVLECGFNFSNNSRPEASLRLGYLTLLDCDNRQWYASHNGGKALEYFKPTSDYDHGKPASSMVSASSVVGATEGVMFLGCGDKAIEINWEPSQCAALPMLSNTKINNKYLNRMWFSLVEQDETLKASGTLHSFSYSIRASNINKDLG